MNYRNQWRQAWRLRRKIERAYRLRSQLTTNRFDIVPGYEEIYKYVSGHQRHNLNKYKRMGIFAEAASRAHYWREQGDPLVRRSLQRQALLQDSPF